MKPRGTGGGLLAENFNLPTRTGNLNDKRNENVKEKPKRGFGMFRMKSKGKAAFGSGTSYEQCFSGSNFTSQYEDECPVNYSLKYSETEPCKGAKKKFKDYSDYAETDLDQPTDFSLKYAEKTYEEENKTPAYTDYNNHKVKLKEYTDYVETDLDQPTDFTLKYRESVEEDVKFGYFEREERKTTPEDTAPPQERLPERYTSQNETPLMFSRSSSMNSLSSFVHITQSIPDDRSSVVSDFSRMTSGIISPSELPDSPTQTAPSSPKRQKPPKNDFVRKRSVFEDDVATYKQEDTPIEFSRATSLSSLNIENPVKSEVVIKSENLKNSTKPFPGSESLGLNIPKPPNLDVYPKTRPQLDYLRKDHQLTAKDETATFATENSPCDISIRSSLSDLTINVIDAPLSINATEEPPSQMLSPLRNVSPQSPNSIGFEEPEDPEKCLEEEQTEFISETEDKKEGWEPENETEKEDKKPETNTNCGRRGTTNLDFDKPLTPFEEALVEECIRLGMHQKKNKPSQKTHFEKREEERERTAFPFTKPNFKERREKKVLPSNPPHGLFDFDSSEPLTPFEEALLEQCIRLGMPQRKTKKN